MSKLKIISLIVILLVLSGCSISEISGGSTIGPPKLEGPFKVTNIVDGDTVDINNGERIRLSGINTPETGECYYQEAKDKLEELILNKEVFLEKDTSDIGKYGRKLRYIYQNNININEVLVKGGYARVYDKYSYDTKRYDQLKQAEQIAIKNQIGVWVCKDPKEGCAYVASKSSDKYHLITCTWAKRIKPDNLVCFHSKQEAEEQGKIPCKTCHP